MALSLLTLGAAWPDFGLEIGDGEMYLQIALGEGGSVPEPFSRRILHPYLAQAAAAVLTVPAEQAFALLAVLAVVGMGATLGLVGWRAGAWPWLLPAIAFSPWLAYITSATLSPELLHALLLAGFFAALWQGRLAAAAFLLLLAGLTRENTLLLAAIASGWFAWRRRPGVAIIVAAAAAAALALTLMAPSHQSNIHGMHPVLYLAFKFLFNALRNLVGLTLWTNSYDFCPDRAVTQLPIPDWLRIGFISQIGLCTINPWRPIETIGTLLTVFGIAPLLAARLLPSALKARRIPDAVAIAGLYGTAALLLSPLTGTGLLRLASFGWPLACVLLPWLLANRPFHPAWARLALLHLAVMWAPQAAAALLGHEAQIAALFATGVLGWAAALAMLRRIPGVRPAPPSPDSSGSRDRAPA